MKKNKIQKLLLIFITVFTTGLIQPGLLKAEDHDFGEVEIGSTETIPVIITNPGLLPVKITLEFDNTACTDFSVVSAPDLDKPFVGEIEIEVGFTPLQIGSCSNTLTVNGIGVDPNSVNLAGIGIEAISDQPEPFNISRPYSNQHGEKVTICHRHPSNPSKAKTLSISKAALEAHLAHGDTEGACPQ